MSAYASALALTLAVEVPVVAACFPRERTRMAITCAIATTITHVVMHAWMLSAIASPWRVAMTELAVVLMEAAAYAAKTTHRRRALPVAALANLASFVLGLVLL